MSSGTYICAVPSDEHAENITQFCIDYNIPNPVSQNSLHATLIYCDQININEQITNVDTNYSGSDFELDVWNDGKNDILVMKFNSIDLIQRHEQLRCQYEFTHGFDNYTPHVTLSYGLQEPIDIDFLNGAVNSYIDEISYTRESQSKLVRDYK
jgi:hypothetical protein